MDCLSLSCPGVSANSMLGSVCTVVAGSFSGCMGEPPVRGTTPVGGEFSIGFSDGCGEAMVALLARALIKMLTAGNARYGDLKLKTVIDL